MRHPIDLYGLLALAEFTVAAARLREPERLTAMIDEARSLLAALGDPIVWSAPLHWAGVQAAILLDSPTALKEHAQALVAASRTNPVAAALSAATKAWVDVLAEKTDVNELQRAARGLADIGLAWDGSRLLAQAAARSLDRRVATMLLQAARAMSGAGDQAAAVTQTDDGGTAVAGPTDGELCERLGLSERELEVARLLVDNLTYREIGGRLYISPKTVEHHVARIKQRLNASGRSELLQQLRGFLARPPTAAEQSSPSAALRAMLEAARPPRPGSASSNPRSSREPHFVVSSLPLAVTGVDETDPSTPPSPVSRPPKACRPGRRRRRTVLPTGAPASDACRLDRAPIRTAATSCAGKHSPGGR